MKSIFRSRVKQLFHAFGYDISRYNSKQYPWRRDAFEAQRRLMQLLNVKEPLVFDIGAHRGQTATKYLRLFPERGTRVHSFEALPKTYERLAAAHGDDHRVRCIQRAIADEEGEHTFYINHLDATNSLLPRPQEEKRYYPASAEPKEKATVQTTTVDRYVEEQATDGQDIEHVDILKLDVQGGELMALRGGEQMLREMRVSLVYSETMFAHKYEDQPLLDEIWALLQTYGYTIYNLYNFRVAPDGQLHQADVIFISPKLREALRDTEVSSKNDMPPVG